LEKLYAGQFLYNQQATETQFKKLAAQYQIIHLAMHGLVDEESPEFSSLAFSVGYFDEKNKPDSSNLSDNFLQCYEIKALELNADLVVLSACETAYGKYERGEGAISIGRSFFYNGTKSLLMTQWSINDAATPVLIGHFYDGLQQGKSKDEALQYAKIQYLTQAKGAAAHPAYWAAFVQMGNTFNLKIADTSYFYYYVLFGAIILSSLFLAYIGYSRLVSRQEK
jgi:CHAT domain-containing protein